jgi:deoxyuridine 5'-triphosphate nucleotidohydrolase
MDSKLENNIQIVLHCNDAVIPTKAHPTDIGYDLTAISVYKKISEKTTLFDTGISLSPPDGFYIEIIPRSSISKTGYMLSNSVGTIDPTYTGNLLISLTKIDDSKPDIELPFTRCQIALRKAETSTLSVVESLDKTVRGSGGFGSTDKKSKSIENKKLFVFSCNVMTHLSIIIDVSKFYSVVELVEHAIISTGRLQRESGDKALNIEYHIHGVTMVDLRDKKGPFYICSHC